MMRFARGNRVLSLAVIIGVLILTAACGTPASSGSAPKTTAGSAGHVASGAPAHAGSANTLNYWANYGDVWPKTLDPCCPSDTLSIYNIYLIYSNLVKLDYPSYKVIPDLASHWTSTSNHKTYTFYIRPNAKFQNGDPVTAQDAAWSITRALLPGTKSGVAVPYLGDIAGAAAVGSGKATKVSGLKVINKHTLQITVVTPEPYFLESLTYPTADVLDKRVVKNHTAAQLTNDCSLNVSDGPFKLVCLNKGSSKSSFYPSGHSPYLRYVPNPDYYGPKPKINIYDPFFSSADDVYKAYEAGELDGTVVPPEDVKVAKNKPGYVAAAQLVTDYITPNQQMPPFNNLHCRLAVAYAIDRVGITTKLLQGTEKPLYDVLPPGLLGYVSSHNGVPYYDPTRAKQELSQCPGHLNHVTMTYQNTSADITHEYDAVVANVAAIGGNITLKPLLFNAWLNIVTQSENATHTQITENLWLDDYPDPQDWMFQLLHSGGTYDIGGFKNATFDKLVDQADSSFNDAQRVKLYTQAQKIALNTGAWIAVGNPLDLQIFSPHVHGMIATNGYAFPKGNNWANVSLSK